MFDTLSASHPARVPWWRVAAGALLLHVAVVAAAVSGTAAPLAATRAVARDTIHLDVQAQVNPLSPEPTQSPIPPAPVMPQPNPISYLPGPELQVPWLTLPPPDLVGLSRRSLPRAPGASTGPLGSASAVFNAMEVDQLPELENELHPRYPEAFQRAGVGGWVEVEYVVGQDGRVDRRSLRVLASSHPAFLLSALEALRGARFRPAREGGRRVAVLVRQRIRFRIR